MNKEEIIQKVNAALMKEFEIPEEKLVPTATFADMQVDSLDVVEMLMALEDEYGISLPDEVAMKLHTVGDIVDYIDANSKK